MNPQHVGRFQVIGLVSKSTLWLAFFMICFGLGYSTLNRYDPTQAQWLSDSQQYFRMVVDGARMAEYHLRYRVLVPYLAKPIYHAAMGHVGNWNPVSFSMLVVNSGFCASSALLLISVAEAFGLGLATGLMAALAYLLNFNVVNAQLAGYVDSSEAFLIICLILVLQRQSWNALTLLGPIGVLGKETFAPIAVLFACGWLWRAKKRPWLQIGIMAVASVAVVVAVRSAIEGHLVTPREIVMTENEIAEPQTLLHNTARVLGSWTTWITFLWLAPFARYGVQRLPRAAVSGTLVAAAGTVAMAIWVDAGQNTSRYLFDVAGPCLSLAFAAGTKEITDGREWFGGVRKMDVGSQ
jgi:hypothetical protein